MPIPDLLYRYHSLSADGVLERDLFEMRRLWFAAPATLNDPFECRPHIYFSREARLTIEEARRVVANQAPPGLSAQQREEHAQRMVQNDPQQRERFQREFTEALQRIFAGVSLKCFSETGVSLPQWAYYGSNHTGYAVGFALNPAWMYRDAAGRVLGVGVQHVHYVDEYPSVDGDIDFRNADAHDWFTAALLSKANHWSHENEWRAVRVNCPAGYQEFPPTSLRRVIIGRRMEEEKRRELVRLVRAYPVPVELLTTREVERRFELELVPYVDA
jgi:DUF2971 family protein